MKKQLKLYSAVLAGALLLLMAFAPLEARVTTINTASIAADSNFTNNIWGAPSTEADLFYRIDQDDAATNTLSIELEVSPDGVNWYDHVTSPTLVSANEADANGYVPNIPVQGYQYRIVANATNTNTVTPNLKIVIRP